MAEETWVWVPDPEWQVANAEERRRYGCRWGAAPGRTACGREPVAWLARGYSHQAWFYCDRHLYGRRFHDGKVFIRVHSASPLAKNQEEAPDA